MNAIKTLLAVSVLAATGAANAAVWNISATGARTYAASGNLALSYTGTWDDVANAGTWSGDGLIGAYGLHGLFTQNFTMNEATGNGTLGALTNCTDGAGAGGVCAGLAGIFTGAIRNNSNAFDHYASAIKPASTGTSFVPTNGGSYVWSLYVDDTAQLILGDPDAGTEDQHYWTKYNLNVTLSQAPAVPVPAAAWLFGSGLLGLAGAAGRRRR
jgi:hypothetical protein